jgi:replication factor A1
MLVCPLGAVDVVEKGQYITLRNAKIDMYKGSMRLAVNQWGKVEPAEKQNFDAKVGAPIAPM